MKLKSFFSILTAGALVLGGSLVSSPAFAAETCNGKKVTISSSAALVKGTAKSDVILVKGNRAHRVEAGAGNDIICGSVGSDTILAGVGNDTILGNAGIDVLSGEEGNDIINGDAGNDAISGGAGVDTIKGGDSNDTISGDDGADNIFGDAGNDVINGDADSDSLNGGTGNDSLNGGAGDDSLDGSDGDDSLDGNDGEDSIKGGKGSDSKHMDGKDNDRDESDSKDAKHDDSEHKVIPQDVTTFLTAANSFMLSVIAAGDLTATAKLSTFPDFPKALLADPTLVAPTSATVVINSVTWKQDGEKIKYCVDGSNDLGVTFYKVRPTDDKKYPAVRITTGKCMSEYVAPVPVVGITMDLTAFARYMISAFLANGIATSGNDVVLPTSSVALTAFPIVPTSSLVKHIYWTVKGSKKTMCADATTDGVQFFRIEAKVEGDDAGHEMKTGACKVEKREEGGQNGNGENNGNGGDH